jgi:hypothetical protein
MILSEAQVNVKQCGKAIYGEAWKPVGVCNGNELIFKLIFPIIQRYEFLIHCDLDSIAAVIRAGKTFFGVTHFGDLL